MSSVYLFSNNATTTIAGAITSSALSVNLSAGSGVEFPSPSVGQLFVGTFVDAATGLLNEIVWCTARASDTLTIIRAQEGTTALNWSAGDLFSNLWTAGSAAQMFQQGQIVLYTRPKLTADQNFYVNAATGNDSNDGSSGSPWLTLQKCADYVNTVDLNNFNIIFNCTGAFTAGVSSAAQAVGQTGPAAIKFLFTSGSSVHTTNSFCFNASYGSAFTVDTLSGTNVNLQCAGSVNGFGYAVAAYTNGAITVGKVDFGACYASHMTANGGQILFVGPGYTISGSAPTHMAVIESVGGTIAIDSGSSFAVTVSGSVNFSSAFAYCGTLGLIRTILTTYTGGTVTGQRYYGAQNGLIQTGSANVNYYPGSVAGAVNTGAQYS